MPGPGAANILWLSTEDIDASHGCYGDPDAITPNIDKLAAEGVRYTRVFTVAPVCAPNRSCIITGVYPSTLGSLHMRSSGEGSKSHQPAFRHRYVAFRSTCVARGITARTMRRKTTTSRRRRRSPGTSPVAPHIGRTTRIPVSHSLPSSILGTRTRAEFVRKAGNWSASPHP